jgi:hypothetical protein
MLSKAEADYSYIVPADFTAARALSLELSGKKVTLPCAYCVKTLMSL